MEDYFGGIHAQQTDGPKRVHLKALDPKPNSSCTANNVQPVTGVYICIPDGYRMVLDFLFLEFSPWRTPA